VSLLISIEGLRYPITSDSLGSLILESLIYILNVKLSILYRSYD
jgi:hypothetical protein